MKKVLLGVFAVVLLFPLLSFAHGDVVVPTAYVNDFAKLLKPETVTLIEQELKAIDAAQQIQIAVVTIPTLLGETIEGYAVDLFKDWGIGAKGKDTGVLLLIARDERQVRIEVGYGLEGELTDIESKRIIDEAITPNFKEENYDAGVIEAVQRIAIAVGATTTVPVAAADTTNQDLIELYIFIGIIILVIVVRIIGGPGVGGGFVPIFFGGGSGRSSGGSSFSGFGGGRSGGGGASGSW
jgi:uncharacterized protein